jgi:hypothetical protein
MSNIQLLASRERSPSAIIFPCAGAIDCQEVVEEYFDTAREKKIGFLDTTLPLRNPSRSFARIRENAAAKYR